MKPIKTSSCSSRALVAPAPKYHDVPRNQNFRRGKNKGDSVDQVEGESVPIYVLIQTHSKRPSETALLQRSCSGRSERRKGGVVEVEDEAS